MIYNYIKTERSSIFIDISDNYNEPYKKTEECQYSKISYKIW